MGVSKVVYGDDTLIDISEDTVTANDLLSGVTAHDSSGTRVTGNVVIPTDFVPASTGGTFEGDVTIDKADGTTSTIGQSKLILGNSTGSGTDENSKGVVRLYSRGSKYVDICAPDESAISDNYELNVPNKSGTLAVTTDIPAAQVNSDWNASSGVAEILNKPTSMTPSSHTHGNIQNGGTLQTNDITIANGDKLVVTDSSDSNKIARASVSFDGSTTTKALTQKGTFESFAKSGDITTAIQALDVTGASGISASKTISGWSETDGKVSISTQNISITKSQVSDFPTIPAAVAVKGNAETNYRTGNVNLTPANIGALALSGGSLSGNLTVARANSTTTSVDSIVEIGNSTPSGTAGCTRGYLRMYGTNNRCAQFLPPNDLSANRNYTLPTVTGNVTLAHTGSDITGSAASLKSGSLTYCSLGILTGNASNVTLDTKTSAKWALVQQADGNLVVYQGTTARWNSGTSSRRFKHNIQDMTEERARKILDIRPVTFDWNDDQPYTTGQNDNAGVIAEEVSEICPDLVVFEDLEDGSQVERRVEYERFTPYLIKMVQMQQREIDILKEEVRMLKERL